MLVVQRKAQLSPCTEVADVGGSMHACKSTPRYRFLLNFHNIKNVGLEQTGIIQTTYNKACCSSNHLGIVKRQAWKLRLEQEHAVRKPANIDQVIWYSGTTHHHTFLKCLDSKWLIEYPRSVLIDLSTETHYSSI